MKVLILGAGMVVKPIVTYLLEKNYFVTVADRIKAKADDMVANHPRGTAMEWSTDEASRLDKMVASHDLTVSLLPWIHHIMVARHCIRHGKSMVTTSYVRSEMKELDQAAKDAGIIILNELGLDPGIDHMSAMRIIDGVHAKGGKIEVFYSICGALPAPEVAKDNPFHYKFSWSPKGVILAGNNDATFLLNGRKEYISTENLFKNPMPAHCPGVGTLHVYPNRDSIPYINLYGIPEVKTMMRGTFRHPGWCEVLDAMKALKLTNSDAQDFTGKTYGEMVAMLSGMENTDNLKEAVAEHLGLTPDAHAIQAMEWLGLFSNQRMHRRQDNAFEVVSDLMMEKMMIGLKERDMVAMQHLFLVRWPDGSREGIQSCLLDHGTRETDTAIARTVALPAAVAAEMIMNGEITATGVHIPVIPDLYNPILDRLETMGIGMVEKFRLPETHIFSPNDLADRFRP